MAEISKQNMIDRYELLNRIDALHTTRLGIERIRKNLSLEIDSVLEWSRAQIVSPDAQFRRQGKNWYVSVNDIVFTINATSLTIITARRKND